MTSKSSTSIRIPLLILALVLLALAVWRIAAAGAGLETVSWSAADGTPLETVYPAEVDPAGRPLVLVAHGFAGSRQVMRGFSYSLAHAGYTVVAWDFDGHGANPNCFLRDPALGYSLQHNAESALAEARSLLGIGADQGAHYAILGHSMGSGEAILFGRRFPETSATIAVSPVEEGVTPDLPHNLLLMAGQFETPFVKNAEGLLAQAGGAGGDPALGTARAMQVIPFVEHVSILFSPVTHKTARGWLDATFGPQPGGSAYTDLRMVWYGVGVLGALLLSWALAPLAARGKPGRASSYPTESSPERAHPAFWRCFLSLAVGALAATLVLCLLGDLGLGLSDALGLLVGGYLLLWFGLAGVFAWLMAFFLCQEKPGLPSRRDLPGAILVSAVLWLGVGLLGHFVWQPWLLIPARLLRWPLGALLLLPWFLAVGQAMADTGLARQTGWWLAHNVILIGGLVLAIALSPELGFLTIILPLFPLVLGLHALAAAPFRGGWSYALSGAMYVSWLVLAVFPLR